MIVRHPQQAKKKKDRRDQDMLSPSSHDPGSGDGYRLHAMFTSYVYAYVFISHVINTKI